MSATQTSTEQADLKAVMDRIAKIRELAARGGTQHEAEAAAVKMAGLLLRYNLSLADIELHAQSTGRKVIHEQFDIKANAWRQDLMFVVSGAHLCQAVVHTGRASGRCHMTVVGHEHNLIVVRETWGFLEKEILRLSNAALRRAVLAGNATVTYSHAAWLTAFRSGAVVGIEAAYLEMKRRVEQDAGDSWAIVPVLNSEVKAAFDQLFPKTGTLPQRGISSLHAFNSGIRAGKSINLSRQVGGSASTAQIEG